VLNSASHPPTNMSTSSTGYGYIYLSYLWQSLLASFSGLHAQLLSFACFPLVFVLQATKAGCGGLGTRLITATPSGLLFWR